MRNGPYELIIAPIEYPGKTYQGKYCYEHHYIYWKHTGKLVKQNENIHHINRNRRDNRFNNFELMTKTEHTIRHMPDRNQKKVKPIICICKTCKKGYPVYPSKYRWKIKNKKKFFCSRPCIGKSIGIGRVAQ